MFSFRDRLTKRQTDRQNDSYFYERATQTVSHNVVIKRQTSHHANIRRKKCNIMSTLKQSSVTFYEC